jgi:hypothetical protein
VNNVGATISSPNLPASNPTSAGRSDWPASMYFCNTNWTNLERGSARKQRTCSFMSDKRRAPK